ncbi:endosialidase [Candidatus Epulonipiscium fishelsonii]|uniref:Endosialidase n=1 Tax=Candidatus Epulonipiscium fishelsonii TaxID=77094 RepID=A0ACC8XGL7_9FIRM|nr:endosialidase [Epulopiscium sp. SCG-B05WGA-EpuloA1]ONI42619.1 endosialidase [Epulopiscium sp. SCG-B11WGA-EpuloA1]ONI47241.1 endosialidase [Epulopiscium sp. SCG-C06WGA-EpuloA1]
MGAIAEIIKINSDDTLSFGDFSLDKKTKVLDFKVDNNFYKAKTFKEVTKLKKDGKLVYESIPGTQVHHFSVQDKGVRFFIEGYAPTQITLELEPNTNYELKIDKEFINNVKTTSTGKVNITVVATDDEKLVELMKK